MEATKLLGAHKNPNFDWGLFRGYGIKESLRLDLFCLQWKMGWIHKILSSIVSDSFRRFRNLVETPKPNRTFYGFSSLVSDNGRYSCPRHSSFWTTLDYSFDDRYYDEWNHSFCSYPYLRLNEERAYGWKAKDAWKFDFCSSSRLSFCSCHFLSLTESLVRRYGTFLISSLGSSIDSIV